MEIGQIQCDNLGMTRDTSVSALGKSREGSSNYAYENYNIRILAVNDNTKFSVTNEKGTVKKGEVMGSFIGGCKLNRYLVLFTKGLDQINPDYIYRLEYTNDTISIVELFHGNLNFSMEHPIEALGYYESEEIQKVYWVDGLNQNRFINIVADAIEVASWVGNNNAFDFQGHVKQIPEVTIEKDYSKAGSFLAGTIQYFITYYKKYGVETCIIWNSDLQYLSLSDRGAKADENVSCGFDFTITKIDTDYDFLRIYSCYRSSVDGVANTAIIADISLEGKGENNTIQFTDLGVNAQTFNSGDVPYIGGQTLIANTLDYKQDTLFLGDIKLQTQSINQVDFNISNQQIVDLRDENGNPVIIKAANAISWIYKKVSSHIPSGVYSYESELNNSQEEIQGFKWREVYRFGIQFMTNTGEWTPAKWIGDKYCNLHPLHITKDILVKPFTYGTITTTDGSIYKFFQENARDTANYEWENTNYNEPHIFTINRNPAVNDFVYSDGSTISTYKIIALGQEGQFQIKPDSDGITEWNNVLGTNQNANVLFTGDGDYIAEASVNFQSLCTPEFISQLKSQYRAYRLLVADMDITSRRIAEQGVINPTMFSYVDRYYNKPYSIPSWSFRPRTQLGITTAPINRHYDTFPESAIENSEIQGIISKQIPGFDPLAESGEFNAYLLIISANDGGSYVKWKLIYYNMGDTDKDKLTALETLSITDSEGKLVPTTALFGDKYKVVSSGTIKKVAGKWDTVYGEFLSKLNADTINSGEKIVISPAMLPGSATLKDIAFQKGDDALIWAIVGLVVAALAAAVTSIFTAGVAAFAIISTAVTGIATVAGATTAVVGTVLTVALTMGALAAGAGVATIAQNMDQFQKIDREMAAKGFLPVNMNHGLIGAQDDRSHTGYIISDILKELFTTSTSSNYSPFVSLIGDTDSPFTHQPSTAEKGALGMDYNAFVSGGPLTYLSAEEEDLKKKGNLFCIDESIVTLNAPDVEDVLYSIDNSEAYKLDLVGAIDVAAIRGEYDLQVTSGLNNSSQVLPNRNVSNPLGSVDTYNILGLVQGSLYQDTYISEGSMVEAMGEVSQYDKIPNMMVTAATALYKVWMWNRDTSAGLWMPGLTLLDPILSTPAIGGEPAKDVPITTPGAQLFHKVFANLRYSPKTTYYTPYSLDIEYPVVCVDQEVTLKKFTFNGEDKFYYGNVNTISTNDDPYYLVVNNAKYPQTITINPDTDPQDINLQALAQLTDPVNIKYKQTPHILIPIKTEDGIHKILPYTQNESAVHPLDLYPDINNIKLNGIKQGPVTSQFILMWSDISNWSFGFRYNAGVYSPSPTELNYEKLMHLMRIINHSFNATIEDITTTTGYYNQDIIDNSNITDYIDYTMEHIAGVANGKRILLYINGSGGIKGFFIELYYTVNDYNVKTWYCVSLTSTVTEKIEGQLVTRNRASFSRGSGLQMFLRSKKQLTYTLGSGSPVQITFSSSSRFIVTLYNPKDYYFFESLQSNNIIVTTTDTIYNKLTEGVFRGDTWIQYQLNWQEVGATPYLFLGELVKKVFDYNTWLGGTQEQGLKQVTWNVASRVTPVTTDLIKYTWGDTFYQRWDCQKTFPFTEEDKNSVVDVLSFMLESHKNLDGRCDVNRGISNLLNIRPSNTMFNQAYNQKDNFFSYQLLDKKFDKTHFEADVLWSLRKYNNDDIDKWTSLVASNEMSLDGRYGTIRKILNLNDTLLAFQDQAITTIKYNEQVALATTAGLPVQMGNTNKVTGYRFLTDTSGCHNKFSISKNSAGVFYVDDYNKSFNQITLDNGSMNIGVQAEFSQWFKRHITGDIWTPKDRTGFRTSYDEITSDLYLISKSTCLVYNTALQRFTSFMDYKDTPMLTNMFNVDGQSGSFAVRDADVSVGRYSTSVYKMFADNKYGYIYDQFRPYSIEYRITPDPNHDSVFTNYTYTADWVDPTKDVDSEEIFTDIPRRFTTFDEVKAYNEYQKGELKLETSRMGIWSIKTKFRIWRGDIPRDGYSTTSGVVLRGDRMRNPWIHLKFTKNITDDSKMTFHKLTIIYYNQYGRI